MTALSDFALTAFALSGFALTALVALALDALIGWPGWVFARLSHPVVWLGRLIGLLENRLNRGRFRVAKGALLVVLCVVIAGLPALCLQAILPHGWVGAALAGVLAWPLIAARSMHDHVTAIAHPLAANDIPAARQAVAMIVGRDTRHADSPAIARAAIESLAENASDGIFAPLFWCAIAGLPGVAAYKAINTMDSMIGHRNARYERFGKVAARLDDLVNLIPARLSAVLFALACGPRAGAALRLAWRQAGQHRSPNAGWPEAAMAAALDIRLSGPRIYGQTISNDPWVNGAFPDPRPADLWRALALFRRACWLAAMLLAATPVVAALLIRGVSHVCPPPAPVSHRTATTFSPDTGSPDKRRLHAHPPTHPDRTDPHDGADIHAGAGRLHPRGATDRHTHPRRPASDLCLCGQQTAGGHVCRRWRNRDRDDPGRGHPDGALTIENGSALSGDKPALRLSSGSQGQYRDAVSAGGKAAFDRLPRTCLIQNKSPA